MRRRRDRRVASLAAVAAAVGALGLSPCLLRAVDTWDNSNGNNQWSTAANWADNSEPTSSDAVTFPDPKPSVGAITLSMGEVASSLTFNNGYTLSGGTLALTTGSINCNTSFLSQILTSIQGTSGLTKSGPGQLDLVVANGFSGTATITSGELWIGADSGLGAAANGVTLNGGTLDIGATFSTSRAFTLGIFTGNGGINVLGGATLTMNGGFAAASSSNPLHIIGGGTLVLNTTTTRSGLTHIQNGTVRLNNASALGSGGDFIETNGTLEIAAGLNHVNTIFLKPQSKLRTLGAGVAASGTIFVDASGSSVTLNTGDTTASTLQLGGPANNLYTGGTGAKTIVNGLGTVTILSAINDYAGDWQIDSGTLRPIANGSLGSGTSPVVVNNSGNLQLFSVGFDRAVTLNHGSTLTFESPVYSLGKHVIASGATVTFAFKGAGTEFLGDQPNDLTGGGSTANINVSSDVGGAVLALNYPNDYGGKWTIGSFATVRISDPTALGTGTTPHVINNGGTLQLASLSLDHALTLNDGGTLAFENGGAALGVTSIGSGDTVTVALKGTGNAFMGDAINEVTAGSSSAVITVTSETAGNTLSLNQANNYGGTWAIENLATLRVASATALGPGTSVISNRFGGTLELANITSSRFIGMNNGSTLRGTGTNAAATGIVIVANPSSVQFGTGASSSDVLTLSDAANELIGGGGTSLITVVGSGKVVLTQQASYSGKWNIASPATLEISADNQLGNATSSLTVSTGGTLSTTASFSSARTFTAAGGTFLTAPSTTLTLTNALATGSGALIKQGSGTLTLNASSSRTGATTINAGAIRMAIAGNPLGTGQATVNNGGTLELAGASVTNGGITLNNGATLKGTGTSAYSQTGNPQIANGPGNVFISVPGASDRLSIGSAIRSVSASASSTTVHFSGDGVLAITNGGTTASDIFGGQWEMSSGILQLGQAGVGQSINGLGFKNGDAKQGNTIAINDGTLAVGVLGSGTATPAFLRADVVLAGGAIASTNGIDAQFGGDFIVTGDSRVLTFDPQSTSTARNVNLVAGAVGTDNLDSLTLWASESLLTVDPGTTTGGAFNIMRNGGTVIVIPAAALQINAGATVNLGGTADALSDGINHVNIINNSLTTFRIVSGSKNVGQVGGFGNMVVDAGCTLTATHIFQLDLNVANTARVNIRPNADVMGVSRILSFNLNATGKLDLSDNKLITFLPAGSWNGSAYTGVAGLIASGKGSSNTWNGTGGIITSQSQAIGSNYTTLGVARASDVRPATSSETTLWGGQTITGTDTLVMYTYGGDANLDGKINVDDYIKIDSGIAANLTGWSNGDFNYDGKINIDDYTTVIDANIGNQNGVFPTTGGIEGVTAVPEPVGGVLLAGALYAGDAGAREAVMRNTRSIRRTGLVLAAAVAAAIGRAADAATTAWVGPSGGNWNAATNWTLGQPAITDTARFPSGFASLINLSSGRVANSLLFQDPYALIGGNLTLNSGTITTDPGMTVTISSPLLASGGFGILGVTKNGSGTLTLSGVNSFQGDVTVNAGLLRVSADTRLGNFANQVNVNGGTLEFTAGITTGRFITVSGSGALFDATGGALGVTGTLAAQGGGDVTSSNVNVEGSVSIDGAGSTWQDSSQINIGEFGHGLLFVLDGAGVASSDSVLGNAVGSIGDALVDGASSSWSSSSDLVVGFSGKGTLAVQSGADITSVQSHLGSVAGSTGTATISGAGSTWINTGFLGVGYSGTGTLNIQSGASVTTSSTFVATDPLSKGTVNISGAGSSWNVNGAPVIGERGSGSLVISAGGTLTSTGGFVARVGGSIGTATITGTGSSWTNGTSTLTVGGSGNATLTVQGGGTLINGFASIGVNNGSSSTVTVTGPGSIWTNSADLSIGGNGGGKGVLNILLGGAVSNVNATIGSSSTGLGAVTVNGTGSTWTNSGDLTVGSSGPATLKIEAGGSVSNGFAYVGRFGGGSGTVLVTGAGSLWTSTIQMLVGDLGGTGAVTIQDGAHLNTSNGLVGSYFATGSLVVTGAGTLWTCGNFNVGFNAVGTVSIQGGATANIPGGTIGHDLGWGSTSGTLNVSGVGSMLNSTFGFSMSGSGATSAFNITGGTANVGGNITDGGVGVSTLTLDGGTLDMQGFNIGGANPIDNLNFRSGTLKNVAQINNGAGLTKTTAGTLTLDGTNTYTGVTTVSAGLLIFKTTYKTGSGIDIAAAANAQIAQSIATPNNVVLKTPSINTNTTGRIDIRDNKIITSAAVGTWDGSVYTGITGQIQHGRNSLPMKWGGGGIVTSMTDATGAGNFTSVAVARAVEVKPATASVTALWAGQTITGTDTLVMYTYGGDANLDGKINVDDYIKIDSGIASNLTGWSNGDFNYDGKINIDDYTTVIDANIGNQNGVFPSAYGVTSVPDPISIGVLASTLLLTRRRRRPADH